MRAGQTFTHDKWIEPNWTPDLAKGETYGKGCAPKAVMVITRVAKGMVWYDFASTSLVKTRGRWVMPQTVFEERFGAVLADPKPTRRPTIVRP